MSNLKLIDAQRALGRLVRAAQRCIEATKHLDEASVPEQEKANQRMNRCLTALDEAVKEVDTLRHGR
jgi:hypothetical protein